jgi:hypothetical protein
VQHIKIYLPCNFEVNPITHFDRLCKLEKGGMKLKKKSSLKLLSFLICIIGQNRQKFTFWLKIEQFWPFEEISNFSNGGHLGYRTVLTDTILKGENCVRHFRTPTKMAATAELNLT